MARLDRPRLRSLRDLDPVVEQPDDAGADDGQRCTRSPERVKISAARGGGRRRSRATAPTTMTTPPIVGVPALVVWPCGHVLVDRLADAAGRAASRSGSGCRPARRASDDAAGEEEADHGVILARRRRRRASTSRRDHRGRRTATTRSPIIWVVSWPLPAITHHVARRGAGRARAAMAARRSGSTVDGRRRSAMPATTASMIASGSSLRGLSEVTTTAVGEPGGDLAHPRPLGRVAVAAAAEHDDHPAAGATSSRAAASSCSRPSGVWA